MNQPFYRSSAKIIKIVPKSVSEHEYICSPNNIPVNKPAFFMLGGEETTDETKARFYGRYIRTILAKNDVHGIDYYSVFYDFGSRIPKHDRVELFRAAGKRVVEHEANNERYTKQITTVNKFEPNPIFIQILFDKIFKPRIANPYGRRHDTNTAIEYARNAKFFTHCQGASTLLMLQNMLQHAMKDLGYTDVEIALFLKNIVAINHEPLAPVDQIKMTCVSFMSVRDAVLRDNTMFDDNIMNHAEKIKPMYFESTHTLIVPNVRATPLDSETDEHSTFDLGDNNDFDLSVSGKILFAAERNAIIKTTKAAIEHKPIPTNLITGRGVKYSELVQNANDFMRSVYTAPQIQVRDYQK